MTVFIIDASHYQAGLDVTSLASQGFTAAIFKATEGTTYVDPSYASFIATAKQSNFACAAYHFLHNGNEDAQAKLTAAVVTKDIPVWIDVEAGATLTSAYAYAAGLKSRGLKLAGIYGPRPGGGYGGWWRAAYLTNPVGYAVVAYGALGGDASSAWIGQDLWQYTSNGKLSGYNGSTVDFSAYRGTAAQLLNTGWFWTSSSVTAQSVNTGVDMIIINTPSNGSFLLTSAGRVGIDSGLASRLSSAGFPSISAGAIDTTAITVANQAIINGEIAAITVPIIDTAQLAADIVAKLPAGTTGLTAEHIADVLSARLAQ